MNPDNIIYDGPLNAGYEEVNFMSIMKHLYGQQVFGTQMAEMQIWFLPEFQAHIQYSRFKWNEIGGEKYAIDNIAYELIQLDSVKVTIESALSKDKLDLVKQLVQRAADHNPYLHEWGRVEFYHPDHLPNSNPPFTSLPYHSFCPSAKKLIQDKLNLVDKLE